MTVSTGISTLRRRDGDSAFAQPLGPRYPNASCRSTSNMADRMMRIRRAAKPRPSVMAAVPTTSLRLSSGARTAADIAAGGKPIEPHAEQHH